MSNLEIHDQITRLSLKATGCLGQPLPWPCPAQAAPSRQFVRENTA